MSTTRGSTNTSQIPCVSPPRNLQKERDEWCDTIPYLTIAGNEKKKSHRMDVYGPAIQYIQFTSGQAHIFFERVKDQQVCPAGDSPCLVSSHFGLRQLPAKLSSLLCRLEASLLASTERVGYLKFGPTKKYPKVGTWPPKTKT